MTKRGAMAIAICYPPRQGVANRGRQPLRTITALLILTGALVLSFALSGAALARDITLPKMSADELISIAETRIVILATADDALHRVPHARLRRVRGQLTHIPAARLEAPHGVVLRGGFVLPPVDGLCVAGASYDIGDEDPAPRASSHEGNLERLQKIFSTKLEIEIEGLQGRVAFRTVAPDRLPLVGRLEGNLHCVLAFGSRGLVWSALAAELLASRLEGEPLPLEGQLADALDPGRFALRASRRAGSRGSRGARPSGRTAPS